MSGRTSNYRRKTSPLLFIIPVVLVAAALVYFVFIREPAEKEIPSPPEITATEEPVAVDPQKETYDRALALMESGEFRAALAEFEALGDYQDSASKLEECRGKVNEEDYAQACALFDEGKLRSAKDMFSALGDYSDSAEKCAEAEELVAIADAFANANVGDTVTFGLFEQDTDTDNGSEPIEWVVIDKDGDSAFIVSLYVLYNAMYHKGNQNVTWETCKLREELNSDFLSVAFTEKEVKLIIESLVTADRNLMFNTDPGNDTNDKIFCLSSKEVEDYLSPLGIAAANSTAYATAGGGTISVSTTTSPIYSMTITPTDGAAGVYIPSNGQIGIKPESTTTYGFIDNSLDWWLRTPGDVQTKDTYVNYKGVIVNEGYKVNFPYYGVRPAIRVSLLNEE